MSNLKVLAYVVVAVVCTHLLNSTHSQASCSRNFFDENFDGPMDAERMMEEYSRLERALDALERQSQIDPSYHGRLGEAFTEVVVFLSRLEERKLDGQEVRMGEMDQKIAFRGLEEATIKISEIETVEYSSLDLNYCAIERARREKQFYELLLGEHE